MVSRRLPEWEVTIRLNIKTEGNGYANFSEIFYVVAPGDWQARRNAKRRAKNKYGKKVISTVATNCKKQD